jgi:hypothetical protein
MFAVSIESSATLPLLNFELWQPIQYLFSVARMVAEFAGIAEAEGAGLGAAVWPNPSCNKVKKRASPLNTYFTRKLVGEVGVHCVSTRLQPDS